MIKFICHRLNLLDSECKNYLEHSSLSERLDFLRICFFPLKMHVLHNNFIPFAKEG